MLLLGAVLITLSSQVKLPSLLALGFVAMALARRWGGNLRAVLAAGRASRSPVVGRDGGDRMGQRPRIRLGEHPRDCQRGAELDVAADVVGARHRPGGDSARPGRSHHRCAVPHPCHRRGDHRGHGVLAADRRAAGPTAPGRRARCRARRRRFCSFPWCSRGICCGRSSRWRRGPPGPGSATATIVVTLVVGIFGPTANGDRFALFQIVDATVASAITVLILIALTSSMLPWRTVPHPVTSGEEAAAPEPVRPEPDTNGRPPRTGPTPERRARRIR